MCVGSLHLCLLSLEGSVAALELGLEVIVNYLDMVLGTKLWSSGKTLCTLNPCSISPAHI